MLVLSQLITFQQEKAEFLRAYLLANDMLEARATEQNFVAMKEIIDKKQGLAAAIDVVDDKIIQGIARLKEETGTKDLSEIDVVKYPEIKTLKLEAGQVLRLMVELKASEVLVSSLVDQAFDALKKSVRQLDKNKLYHYTQKYFEQQTDSH